MLTLSPITAEDLLRNSQESVFKFEVYDGSNWLDLTSMAPLSGDDILAGWNHRKQITISGTYIDDTLTDFPLCIKIDSDPDIGAFAQADGDDIRFTSSDGQTLLKYEIESFSITSGIATGIFWVKIPSLPSAGTDIFIYYGNSSASSGQDPENVWDSDFKAVWHMKDGTTSTTLDSTVNNNDGTKGAANQPIEVDGKIGKGQDFDGSDDRIDVVENSSLQTNAFNRSIWFKINSSPDDTIIREIWRHAYRGALSLRNDLPTKTWQIFFHDSVPTECGWSPLRSAISIGEWHHIVIRADGSNWNIDFDGVTQASGGYNGTVRTSAANMTFGCGYGPARWFDCEICEARVSSIARSSAWVKFEYHNMADSDNSISFSTDQSLSINYLKSISCQIAGAGKNIDPLAGSWSVNLDNNDGIFHPYHPTSAYKDLLRLGRKARLSWGIKESVEILTDGSLESWTSSTNLTSWTEQLTGSSTIERESTEIHGGTYSLKMTVDSSNSYVCFNQAPTMITGADYHFQIWAKIPTGSTGGIVIGTQISGETWVLHQGNVWLRSTDPGYVGHITMTGTSDWTLYGTDFTWLGGINHYFLIKRLVATSQILYFDDATLRLKYKTAYFWQRIIGFMDQPRFNHGDKSVQISGTDYMKILADTAIYSPYTNWGSLLIEDSQASPGGIGIEIYNEADACEIGSDEADNVTNWSDGASGGSTESVTGTESNYALHFIRDAPAPTEQYTENTNVGSLTAGLQYTIGFYGKAISDGRSFLKAIQGTTTIGIEPFGDDYWRYYEFRVTAISTGALILRLSSDGKYASDSDEFWIDEITIKLYDTTSWYRYDLPEGCKGIYSVILDGSPVWHGDEDGKGGWHYDPDVGVGGTLFFSEDMLVNAGTDNLYIYYYTATAPEDVIADLMVAGHLYASRSAAKAAMVYTATGITIDRVWFDPGISALEAVKMICERVNYRFWFGSDGVPNFIPAPTLTTPSDFSFTSIGHLAGMELYQDLNEVKNSVTIEGSERSVEPGTEEKNTKWIGTKSDATSIAAYQEKTYAINNHLFQDQTSIDDMAQDLLDYYKTPKWYVTINLAFCPVPLEVGDTITIQIPISDSVSVEKYAIIRAIDLSDGEASYQCEIYVPINIDLLVDDASMGLTADNAELILPGVLSVQEATMGFTADNITLPQIFNYTTEQNSTSLVIPSGFTQAVIECWGSGGNGGDGEIVNQGGGGGGGAYSKSTVTVAASDTLVLYLRTVTYGSSTLVTKGGVTLCEADNGSNGDNTQGGQGGQSSSGTGDTKYSGGNGYMYPTGYTGGGGGSSAGTGSNGTNATSSTGASAVTGGGPGGNGGSRYNDGSDPTSGPGGGGGGAGEDLSEDKYGGYGYLGRIRITLS